MIHLIVFALMGQTGVVPAAAVPTDAAGASVTIRTDNERRPVDCGGGSLSVEGNGNQLDIVHCASVSVLGNRNAMAVQFPAGGVIRVLGDDNSVHWSARRTMPVRASNLGARNVVDGS